MVYDNGVGRCIHAAESHTKTTSEDGAVSQLLGAMLGIRKCCVLHGCRGTSLHPSLMAAAIVLWDRVHLSIASPVYTRSALQPPLSRVREADDSKVCHCCWADGGHSAHSTACTARRNCHEGPCNELCTSLTWYHTVDDQRFYSSKAASQRDTASHSSGLMFG